MGSRLHVTICIRDIVFSSVLRSEHAGRYRNAPHICKLNWDTTKISYFFERKIEQLDDIYFDDPDGLKNIGNFLSLLQIDNHVRGNTEDILPYIVRHTRFLPRDIVEIGNALARARLTFRNGRSSDRSSWQDAIRALISRNARAFGEEQLTICGNQLASHDKPEFSARQSYHELYTSGQEYIASRAGFLKNVINLIGSEKFSISDVNDARVAISDDVPGDVDVFSILWQHGLIGCQFEESQQGYSFFNLDDRDDFLLPEHAFSLAFHSCLIDTLDLTVSSASPVVERTIT